jgi:hypothetical protein
MGAIGTAGGKGDMCINGGGGGGGGAIYEPPPILLLNTRPPGCCGGCGIGTPAPRYEYAIIDCSVDYQSPCLANEHPNRDERDDWMSYRTTRTQQQESKMNLGGIRH